MKVLVTGGCGFIGSRLVARLVATGHQVRALDDLSTGTRQALREACEGAGANLAEGDGDTGWPAPGTVTLSVTDVRAGLAVAASVAGADAVVHLAAQTGVPASLEDPRRDAATNVMGTLSVLEAARQAGVRRLVFASSAAAVGECEPPIHEQCVTRPLSPYGAAKLAGEAYCSAYFHSFGLETVVLRFGNVYGPGSGHKASVVARFSTSALRGEAIEIHGDGRQTRDFVFIGDLVEAIERALTTDGVGGEIFQIATDSETSIVELTETLGAVLHEAGVRRVRVARAEERAGDVRRSRADTTKAHERLGWRARVPLDEGLRETVAWFAKHSAA